MLFNKPLDQVKYEDVINICAQEIKENEVLDYKEDFPAKLEKVISAFANTYGGLVIIGVPDVDGKPDKNPVGITYKRGLEESIQSIIMSKIKPPVFPTIQVCPPVNNKTFILIQVSQSSNTPHAIDDNTKVYIRTGNITIPERLVDISTELHWLMRSRQDSVSFRYDLINDTSNRFTSLQDLSKSKIDFAELWMYIIPLYPRVPLFDAKTLKTGLQDLSIRTQGGYPYPRLDRCSIQTMSNGVFLYFNNKNNTGEFTQYTAINNYGLLYQAEDMGIFMPKGEIQQKSVYLSQVIGVFINQLKFYRGFRSRLGVMGDYLLRVSLIRMHRVDVIPISLPNAFLDEPRIFEDKCYVYERIITAAELDGLEKLNKMLFDFVEELHWSLGLPREEAIINKWLENLKVQW